MREDKEMEELVRIKIRCECGSSNLYYKVVHHMMSGHDGDTVIYCGDCKKETWLENIKYKN